MQPTAGYRQKGFALLVTITLLAFLVLLLVSLASLTRVETQVASNGRQSTQARQNALMALNIALGQLQKFAGPDQRVTARADVDSALADTSTQSGRWLGVYGRAVKTADIAARDLYADIPSTIQTDVGNNSDDNGNQAVLLNWLVSGNENTVFNPSTAVDANGQIPRNQAPAAFDFSQTDTVSVGGATALSTDVTVKAKPARLLVGPGSASTASDYVAAPLVTVFATAPGVGSSPVAIGNYAWWVGDENAKARVNLPAASASADKALAFVSSRRAAIELVDGVNPAGSAASFSTTQLIGSAYQPLNANLPNIVAANQLPLLTPGNASALSTAVKHRFHDLTGYSSSVLADTYAGGLKKDLSAILAPLAATGLSSPLDTEVVFSPETNSGSTVNEFGIPTWGQLRSFAQTTAPAAAGLAPQLPVIQIPTRNGSPIGTTPTSTSAVIAPVMTYAALGFQYGVPQSAAPPADKVGNPIHLAVFPVVVLWNPYTTDIKAARYELGLRKNYATFAEFQKRTSANASVAWSASNVIDRRDYGNSGSTSLSAGYSYFRFVIDAGVIPAGQSLVYTLQSNGGLYDTSSQSAMLANALKSTIYNPAGHVLMPSTLTVTETGSTYRVGVNGNSGTYYGTPVTFFYNTSCNFGGNVGGGPGTIEAYLGAFPATTPPAVGSLPYSGNATAGFKSQWYQGFAPMNGAPFNTASPYTLSSSPSGGGYAVGTTANGLLQDETQITYITQPAFRMISRAIFAGPDTTNARTRWVAQSNPRGLLAGSIPSGSNNGGSTQFSARPPSSVGVWPQGLSVSVGAPGGPRTSAGTSLTDITSGPTSSGKVVDAALFEFRPSSQPLMALGQLQHANLAWHNAYPSYAIGNSIGVALDSFAAAPGNVVVLTGGASSNSPSNKTTAFYDLSWLLNRALWDRYFVSTVPHTGTGRTDSVPDTESTAIPSSLPNPRLVRYVNSADSALTQNQRDAKLRDAGTAAASLLLSGGFNINSTSEQAWRAVLGGMNNLSYDPTGSNSGGSASADAVISRFSQPKTNAAHTAAAPYLAWQGYRKLTPEQIAALAKGIVAEIRARGPFVSMSDFVNRRLKDNGTFPLDNDKRLKGAIQAAIDGLPASGAINSATMDPFTTLVIDSYSAAPTNAFKTGASSGGSAARVAPQSSASAFAPQFLTQADVLSAVGDGLSARSDTFKIRTYGESVNPALAASDPGYVTARSWCEAVVQRIPEYLDDTADPDAHATPSASINRQMGRRFKIISFRWLTPNDI